jgi:hypothetical protein
VDEDAHVEKLAPQAKGDRFRAQCMTVRQTLSLCTFARRPYLPRPFSL